MKNLTVMVLLLCTVSLSFAGPLGKKDHIERIAQAKEKKVRKFLELQSSQQAFQENDSLDVSYYKLDLDFDIENKILYGNVKVTFNVIDGPVTTTKLNMWGGLNIDSIIVMPDRAPLKSLKYSRQDYITIIFDRPYNTDETVQIAVQYYGRPQHSDYEAFDFDQTSNGPMIWSQSEPFGARSWWPCKDTPSDKADSMDIYLTVPNDLIAVSNGTLRSKTTNGEKTTWWWHEQYPIATYLVSVAIHPYEVHHDYYVYNAGADSMNIDFYTYPGNYDKYKQDIDNVKHMISFMSEKFGQYPYINEKYGHADYSGSGAMEHQTCSSFSFWGNDVFIHELAHQWGGDWVTCNSFHHIWLNEGFATYSEALWYEHTNTNKTASDYQLGKNYYVGSGTIFVEEPLTQAIFNYNLSYSKASWVFHMLRHIVGDDMFFDIMKAFFTHPDYSYGSATTEQFRDLCEEMSGMELDTFFQQWIYKEGCPVYQYYWDWEALPDNQYRIICNIKQNQYYSTVFEMPLDITIETQNGDTTFTVMNDQEYTDYEFVVSSIPTNLLIDKAYWVLKEVELINDFEFDLTNLSISEKYAPQNGIFESGETINIYASLTNKGHRIQNAQITLMCSNPNVEFVNDTWVVSEWDKDQSLTNDLGPFQIKIAENLKGQLAHFTILISNNMGQEYPLYFHMPIEMQRILLVDDDGGKDTESYYTSLLDQFNLLYDLWDVQQMGVPNTDGYNLLLWNTGDETDSTFNHQEQTVLTNFMQNGGMVFISGQNIGYDLVENGDSQDSLFFTETLHAEYMGKAQDSKYSLTESGHLFDQRLMFNFVYDGSNKDYDSLAEILAPIVPARPLVTHNSSDDPAGIYYTNNTSTEKLLLLAFGLETVSTTYRTDQLLDFISGVFDWYYQPDTTTATELEIAPELPEQFSLSSNYPNPFNPETMINFTVPKSERVRIEIYDILGRQVDLLYNQMAAAGVHSIAWNGTDSQGNAMPSGTYFYRMTAGNFKQIRKLLLLR